MRPPFVERMGWLQGARQRAEVSAYLDAVKAGRGDTDDLKGMTIERELAPDDLGAASVLALPEGVAQDDSLRPATFVVVGGGDQAADQRLDAEHVEKVSANEQRVREMGLAALTEVVAEGRPCGDLGESLLLGANAVPEDTGEVSVVRVEISAAAMGRIRDFDSGQLLWGLHRQGAQAHGIEQLEDGCVCADAQRERQDGNDGEAGIHAQQARPVAKIAPNAGEEWLVCGVSDRQ